MFSSVTPLGFLIPFIMVFLVVRLVLVWAPMDNSFMIMMVVAICVLRMVHLPVDRMLMLRALVSITSMGMMVRLVLKRRVILMVHKVLKEVHHSIC